MFRIPLKFSERKERHKITGQRIQHANLNEIFVVTVSLVNCNHCQGVVSYFPTSLLENLLS